VICIEAYSALRVADAQAASGSITSRSSVENGAIGSAPHKESGAVLNAVL